MDFMFCFYSSKNDLFFMELILELVRKYLKKESEVILDSDMGIFIKCGYFSITIEDETKEFYEDIETNAQFTKKEYNLNVNKSFDMFFLTDYLNDEEIYGNFLKIIRDFALSMEGDFAFLKYDLSGFIFKRENGKIKLYEETDRYQESAKIYNEVFSLM